MKTFPTGRRGAGAGRGAATDASTDEVRGIPGALDGCLKRLRVKERDVLSAERDDET